MRRFFVFSFLRMYFSVGTALPGGFFPLGEGKTSNAGLVRRPAPSDPSGYRIGCLHN
jgi:hypothetical protein